LSKQAVNSALYNESVPMEFTRALLVQARAYNRDVQAILRAARFPFDPLRQDVQTVFVSREQYSRLCLELIRALGDESGGVSQYLFLYCSVCLSQCLCFSECVYPSQCGCLYLRMCVCLSL